ncbi:ABC transporter ATP-binding protein [Microbacterium amylolyticum]|uniref:ABC transport system ATP-binding protein n=1 Tax=Microbacterium amylolyticum TaxID=936337 RepID=A0ABS4ZI39_9MICO|nr:ABC transporter ATP-binding protein [Microbacterium amylolyticum]MBP2436944.1 putative ABC transport system ATP-binding protein [Microbacterium amylolyticum]
MTSTTPESPHRPDTYVLEARALTKTFSTTDPPTQVLHGIDLSVCAGEFLAIMGASGSGKSTLLYALSGMDQPTSGTVTLDGHDLTTLTDTELSRLRLTTMGFVFQQPHFLKNLSTRDNILLPAAKAAGRDTAEAEAHVDALIEQFGLTHIAHHSITRVSGGQLQRAALCRALATRPRIVFADEPTGALNSSMTEEVLNALTTMHSSGTTIVMVTHDANCAARADRVIYLRDGQILDTASIGKWTPEQRTQRETELRGWLASQGF